MEQVTANQFSSSIVWRFSDLFSRKLVGLIVSIILARLIAPEAYGVIALTTIFIGFTNIFILTGFNVALIRKEDVQDIDYSTVTTISLVCSLIIYLCCFILAPAFSRFYDSPQLINVLRVMLLVLFFLAIGNIVRAKAMREMQFKKISIISFSSNVSSSIIAVIFAYKGFGVWALVIQQLLASIIDVMLLLIVFHWRLSLKYSHNSAKEMFGFTMGVIGSSFLDFLANNLNGLIIGKTYSTKDLGYYDRGNMFPEVIGANLYGTISNVLFPTLSSCQNDLERMKRITRKVMSFSAFIIYPVLFGLIGISKVMIPVLLTEKWSPCIPLLCLCCLYYIINPIKSIGYSVFYAMGRSKFCVKVELTRVVMMIIGLFFVVLLEAPIHYVVISNIGVCLIVSLLTHYFVRKVLNYTYSELLKDLAPSLFISLIMLLFTYLIGGTDINRIVLLGVQILGGAGIYLFLSWLFKVQEIEYASDMLRKLFMKY